MTALAMKMQTPDGHSGVVNNEPVIKWAYRYGNLEADTYESLDAAVHAAHYAADDGHEALDSIEVVNEDGTRTVHGADEVWKMAEPISRAEDEAYKARPANVVRLRLQGPWPDSRWGTYGGYSDPAKAEADAEEFRQLLGPERVKIETI